MTPATATVKSCCCTAKSHERPAAATDGKVQARDPVCGMIVNPATAKHQVEVRDQTFYFCCSGCKAKFDATSDQYLNTDAPVVQDTRPG